MNELENEKIQNSNEINENDLITNEEEKNEENEIEEEPIYVMTVELEKGKSESIKIYSNSKPEELAFSFCKKYNLDFSSLSYLSTQIKSLIENLPNGTDDKNNEPIEEVDEENNPPSSEAPSKKFGSQSNSTNLSPGALNNKKKMIENENFGNFNSFKNRINDNVNNINNFDNFDNNNFNNNVNNKNYEMEFQKLKDLNPNKVNNYSNKPLSNLINGFEYKNYLVERFNNKNDNKKNNKQNIFTYKNKNDNNGKKYNNNNKIMNLNDLSESSGDVNINVDSKNNLSGNIDFYKKRNKIFSYEKFFDEFKQNLINKNKEKDNSTLLENQSSNYIKQESLNKKIDIDYSIRNSNPVKKKDYSIPKIKKKNKSFFYFDNDLTLSKNQKNFDMFLNNCNLLDEIYQNKIDDSGVFLNKNLQVSNSEQTKNTLNLNENNNYKLSLENKKYIDQDVVQLKGSKSFKKPKLNKINEESFKSNINYKNILSNSLTNSPNQQMKNNIIFNKRKNKSKIKNSSRNKSSLEKLKNPSKKSYKYYFTSTNKDNNKNSMSSFINNNTNNSEKLSNREILFNQNKDEAFRKLFRILDSDNDGSINILTMETKGIPITIFNILSPIVQNIKNKNDDMKENEFVNLGRNLFDNLSFNERRALFNFTNQL